MAIANPNENQPFDPEPLLVNIPTAAHLLSVGRSTIYELIWNGDLEPVRIGRCVRFRRADLEAYVERSINGE